MHLLSRCTLALLLIPLFCPAEPFLEPPPGYTLVAEDDCGDLDASVHVVQGTPYVFGSEQVRGPLSDRTIVFHNDVCVLRYEKLNPQAAYKVDVTYATELTGPREQSLEANGVLVHDTMSLPAGKPGRFIFDLPRAALSGGGPLELRFVRRSGANAVVSYVRIWSTDPAPLPGRQPIWVPDGPVEKDWLRQDRLRGKPCFTDWENPERELREGVLPCLDEQLARGRAILADLQRLDAPGLDQAEADLAAVVAARDRLLAEGSHSPRAWLEVYRSARWAVRRIAFRNPLLDCRGLLFVRRHHPHIMHQCARRVGTLTLPGGGICILPELRVDGEPTVISLTDGRFPPGTFGRPDLCFDATRILFGYAPQRPSSTPGASYPPISESTAPAYAQHKLGPCEPFQVWEMGLDGSSPRQLTWGPSENSDPLYLPNGRIAFMSHRGGGLVQCGDWALAYCLYTMNPDGSDVRQITRSKDGEWDPFLMEDGTIGFTRWEYVMKFWSPIQMLWSVRPDGTNPRMVYGSDLSREYPYPLNYASARPIPGTGKLVCIGSAHHNTGAGPVCIVDLSLGPSEADGLRRLTPVRYVETPDQLPDAGWYDCPFPLSEKYFLVSYSFSPDETETTSYGLYLLDVYGGLELIYRDPELSALFPIPIRPRPVPPALPDLTSPRSEEAPGEFIIQDVHAGLLPEMRGLARFVQIVECHERHIHTSPYDIQVGPDSGFETKTVLGTVPVEPDGSAYFRVPSGKSVFFSVLDADYRALHTMRSVTNVQPGERTACVGCHEGYRRVPSTRRLLATRREPSDIEPPPWGVRPMSFAEVVQPVLDRHCARCHDGSGSEGKAFDLTASQTAFLASIPVPRSYFNLRQYVRHAPIFQYFLPPGSFGSRVSPVMDLLAKGHHGVTLDLADWQTLCAWIDCNAPALGDYQLAARGRQRNAMREAIRARRAGGVNRRAQVAAALAPDQRLAAYLDCGLDTEDSQSDCVTLREVCGEPYQFGAGPDVADPWYDDISFDSVAVQYDISGLRPDRRYMLGFSWWDHDNAGRVQGVVVALPDGTRHQLLLPTRLPAWANLGQKPEQRILALPEHLTAAGALSISFTNDAGVANAVVSEVWLIEK